MPLTPSPRWTGETRKPGGTFEESEVNGLLEALTRETAVESLDEYLASGKQPEAKPAPKKAEKAEKKEEKKAEAPARQRGGPNPKRPKSRRPRTTRTNPAERRKEKVCHHA